MTPPQPHHERFTFRDLSAHAIRHARLLVVACMGLLALAGLAWQKLPRSEAPRVEPTEAIVTLAFPGASAEDVEADVLPRVDDALYSLSGVEWVTSSAITDGAFFHIKFEEGTAMDTAFERVRGKVQQVKKDLPAGVRDPDVRRLSTDLTPALLVVVVGTRSDEVLSDAARKLKQALSAVDGVAGIDLWGEAERAVRVRIDGDKLREHHLAVDDVIARLQAANVRVPAGTLPLGALEALVEVKNEFGGADSVAATPVGSSRDLAGVSRVVLLRDVATVEPGIKSLKRRFLYGSEPGVALDVRFRAKENALAVGARVHEAIARAEAKLPPGARIVLAHDRQEWTRASLSSFWSSLAEGILLVTAIITIGMGWRASLVVAAILPLAICGALVGIYLTGNGLEQITLAGLIVSIGLLVDDAIVVTESIAMMREKGLGPFRAAVYGTSRVFWANNGTTAVAAAAFFPLFFMSGTIGAFIRGLPLTVLFALVTSLLVAQLLTPWIARWLLLAPREVTPIPDLAPFDREADFVEVPTKGIVVPFYRIYAATIPFVVRRPWVIIGLSCLALAGGLALLPKIGFQFFPKADKPALFVTVEMPRGTRLEETEIKVREVLRRIRDDAGVLDVSAVAGEGYPEIFYGGRLAHRPSRDFGDILVRTRSREETAAVAARLRERMLDVVGANVNVEELWLGPYVPHPVNIRVQGDDYAKLRTYADEIERELRRIPGTAHVTDDMADAIPLAQVNVDLARAARIDATAHGVGLALRSLYGEDKIAEFHRDEERVDVVLQNAPRGGSLNDIERALVRTGTGALAPISATSDVSLGYGVGELTHHNGQRVVQIYSDVEGSTLPDDVMKRIRPFLAAKAAEHGYAYVCAGAAQETSESFEKLAVAAIFAVLVIFVLMILMFGSVTLSLAVIAAIPFGVIGAFTGLYVTHNPFGFMAFLGLIALLAVYANHKIYFVDRLRHLLDRGFPLAQAIEQSGRDRVRPVVLTALTAILGLLPLAVGGGPMWTGFGWVNVFGLAASIPLSLILLPALVIVCMRGRTSAMAGLRRAG